MPNEKIKYKIVKLNKNRENIFAPLMQLRCCCCREANLQCPSPSTYPSLYTCPWGSSGCAPRLNSGEQLLCICFVGAKKICVINGRVQCGKRGRGGGRRGQRVS